MPYNWPFLANHPHRSSTINLKHLYGWFVSYFTLNVWHVEPNIRLHSVALNVPACWHPTGSPWQGRLKPHSAASCWADKLVAQGAGDGGDPWTTVFYSPACVQLAVHVISKCSAHATGNWGATWSTGPCTYVAACLGRHRMGSEEFYSLTQQLCILPCQTLNV